MSKRRKSNKDVSYEDFFSPKDLIGNIMTNNITIKGKNDSQIEFIQKIRDNEITICSGAAGCGKAQPLTSKVLTPNGWVTMGEITIGDEVITQSGNATEVLGVFPQGIKDIYRVTFSDGTFTESCGEHLWLTQTYKDRNYKTKRNGDVVYIPKSGETKTTIEIKNSLLTNDGKKNHNIPMVNEVNFNEQLLEIDPYIMGCILGDGGLTGSKIVITSADKQVIGEINNRLPNSINISKIPSGKYEYVIKSEKRGGGNNTYLNEIKNLGLFGIKSEEKYIPKKYLYNTISNRVKLLQGLMDTDGYVSKNGMKISFTSCSHQLVSDMVELVQSLGGVATIKSKFKTYTYNGEKRTGKESFDVTVSLPPHINPFLLSRKRDRVVPKTKYKPIRYITNVEYIGDMEAQCIMVKDDSHLYVTDNYIVTHNTYLAVGQALKLVKQKTTKYEKIWISRPAVETGKSLGFIPGTLQEKLMPYMLPLLDNIDKIVGKEKRIELMEKEIIEFQPLSFIRGKTIDNAILIMDESQNATPLEMKTLLTRIGEYSKFIITGDIDQSDKYKNVEDSGLFDMIHRLTNLDKVAIHKFTEADIVRNPIITEILKRYK